MDTIDLITINKLEISTLIGTYAFERARKQKLFITIQFGIEATNIAKTDNIAISKAVDYEKLSQTILGFGLVSEFFLLETFAEKLSEHLFERHGLTFIQLEITKPAAIKNAQGVSIRLCRTYPRPV